MFYIVLFQAVLIIGLLVLYVQKTDYFSKKQAQCEIEKDKKTSNLLRADLRTSFRVCLDNDDCLVEFLEFEN